MKTTLQSTAFALALVASAASADHVYKGIAEGNPDLGEPHPQADSATNLSARRAGTDSIDLHHGLSVGNPDLSQPPRTSGAKQMTGRHSDVDIHGAFSGNPDLSPPPPQH
jgi:hypothetical protein